jgi:hypothetical protein
MTDNECNCDSTKENACCECESETDLIDNKSTEEENNSNKSKLNEIDSNKSFKKKLKVSKHLQRMPK